jgi:hypothetical protein
LEVEWLAPPDVEKPASDLLYRVGRAIAAEQQKGFAPGGRFVRRRANVHSE